jgi:hypothetical protein
MTPIVELEAARARALTRAEFEQFSSQPCILKGLTDAWPARSAWTPAALAARLPHVDFDLGVEDDSRMTIAAFVELARSGLEAPQSLPAGSLALAAAQSFPYIFEAEFGELAPELLHEFSTPPMFPTDENDFLTHICESAACRPPYRWLLVGARGSGFTMHQDPFDSSAWNALLFGRKRWVLLPECTPMLRVLPRTAASLDAVAGGGDALPLDESEATAAAWFRNVYPTLLHTDNAIECDQVEGDVLYVPRGWWHVALSIPSSPSSESLPSGVGSRDAGFTVAITQNFMSTLAFDKAVRRMASRSLDAALFWCERVASRCSDALVRESTLQISESLSRRPSAA